MPATQRQRRYDQVMGDREPDVTDKKFVHELKNRLEIKYYESQQAKEKQLAESEKKRMRKLVMEGVVESEDKRQEKSEDSQQDTDWKEFWPPNPNKSLEEYEEEKRRAEEKQQKEAAAGDGRRGQQEADVDGTADGDDVETGGAAPNGEDGRRRRHIQTGRADPLGNRLASRPWQDEEDLDQLYQKASELVYIMAPVPKAKAKAKH
uniref:BUD13 homolog n=1 Tax=Macrostomum lignano TaxID=282301 RepID=A0A1I8I1S0_9PLAT